MADKGKKSVEEPSAGRDPTASKDPCKSVFEILPENAFGTELIPIPVSSDSSDDSDNEYSVEDAKRLYHELRQKKRECRTLYADMHLVESYARVERERRMALEAHLGYTIERLNCLREAINSVLRAADRQGGLSPHHLNAATNLLKEALKKKDEDAARKK